MRGRTRRQGAAVVVVVLLVAALQTFTLWWFNHPHVDESEVVHFAVDMLGGDLDPGWYGYGALNMYMLAAVYRVMYLAQRALGLTADVEDFARELFRGGLFFQVGRYVYAVLGVATVVTLGRAAWRAGIGPRWIAVYALLAVTAADAVFYANYVRIDTVLGLIAAALVLVSARPEINRTVLMLAGVIAAVSISVKVSGALLLAVPAVLALIGLRRRTVTLGDVAIAAVTSIAVGFLVTPFVNPVAVMLDAYSARIASDPFRFGTQFFPSPVDRLARILNVLRGSVGLPAMLLAVAAVTTRGPARRLVVATASVLLLLVLPFTVSVDLPPYWFIPIAALTRFLALLGAVAVVRHGASIAARYAPVLRERSHRFAPVLAGVLAGGLVIGQLTALVPIYRDAAVEGNIAAASRWIEANRTDEIPIRLNGPYLQYLPEVYDPSEVEQSKRISRAFIFDRDGKAFLNRVFIGWLAEEYAPAVTRVPSSFHTVTSIQFALPALATVDVAVTLGTCLDEVCQPVVGVGEPAHDGSSTGTYVIPAGTESVTIGDLSIPGDGSVGLEVQLPGDVDPVVMRYGTAAGLGETGRLVLRGHGPLRYPLWLPQQRDLIEELNLTEAARTYDDVNEIVDRVTWIVSAPDIYNRFLDIDPDTVPEGLRERTARLRSLYRDLVAQPAVAGFGNGSGNGVVIYEVSPE